MILAFASWKLETNFILIEEELNRVYMHREGQTWVDKDTANKVVETINKKF